MPDCSGGRRLHCQDAIHGTTSLPHAWPRDLGRTVLGVASIATRQRARCSSPPSRRGWNGPRPSWKSSFGLLERKPMGPSFSGDQDRLLSPREARARRASRLGGGKTPHPGQLEADSTATKPPKRPSGCGSRTCSRSTEQVLAEKDREIEELLKRQIGKAGSGGRRLEGEPGQAAVDTARFSTATR